MINTVLIAPELPVAPMTGGRIRTYQIARALAQLGSVTIVGFTLEGEPAPTLDPPLRAYAVPWKEPALYAQMHCADELAAARAYQQLDEEVREPWIVSCYESAELRARIRQLCARDVHLVVIEHSLMGAYADLVPSGVPTLLDLHNVHSRHAQRESERGLEAPREVQRVLEYERSLIERATLTITVSEADAAAALQLAPRADVEVVPNGVDASHFVPGGSGHLRGYILFTGLMNYEPNVEAIQWFASEILPLIDRGVLHVVGSRPAPEVEALVSHNLVVHGEVDDTRPYQWSANVVVAPLLSGGGTRLKILEAAACGNAIVSTTLGAEGLHLEPGSDLLIGDSPREFAQAVNSVLSDDELRAQLGAQARRVADRYRWEAIGQRLRDLVRPLVEPETTASGISSVAPPGG